MTYEQFCKLKFYVIWHMSMEDEHMTTYNNKEYGIAICLHQPYKDGEPHGRGYRHYMIGGKVYKTKKALIKALEDIKL